VTTIGDHARANAHITLRNLIAARWVLVALASVSVLFAVLAGEHLPAGLLPSSAHPLAILVMLVGWALLNVVSTIALRRGLASERLAGAHLLVDAVALTILLALSGGPANPFTILYFLPITLATQVSPRWTWVLAGVCVACFAGLFVLTPVNRPAAPVPAPDPHAHHHPEHDHAAAPTPASEHAEHFEGHQRGMWVAFGIAGVLITVFVHRTALALARQHAELARLRQAALEDRHLTAVGTLAAGAAHELGTPLATISLLADELPHLDADEAAQACATIQGQLARCKLIVSRMASPELRVSALGARESWTVAALLDELDGLDGLDGLDEVGVPIRVHAREGVRSHLCRQPFEVLSQLLRELISNATEACRRSDDPSSAVCVTLDEREGQLLIDVVDRGIGMDAEALASAFDPFHSTRPEGMGMGLGLYLARAHLRQLGGSIQLESELGHGTTVHVELPLLGREGPP
jgi:two-component system, sensor histidine kinase RegB